jgi:hypothetical protein
VTGNDNDNEMLGTNQLRQIQVLSKKSGLTVRNARIGFLRAVVGRSDILTTTDLTSDEAVTVIAALKVRLDPDAGLPVPPRAV